MTRLRILVAVSLLILQPACQHGSTLAGGADATRRTHLLSLDLVDTSAIIGETSIESVSLHTSFGRVDVPLRHVRRITIEADHEHGTCQFHNGDTLTGVIDVGPIKLDTLFGKASIAIEHVKTIGVVGRIALSKKVRNHLVLYYPFDKDDTSVKDHSGRENHGTSHGAKFTNRGVVNGAFVFDGVGSFVECPDHSSLDLAEEMTIVFWVKFGPPPAGYAAQILYKARRDPRRNAMITWYYYGGHPDGSLGVAVPIATVGGKWGTINDGFKPTQDVWYQLALTCDGKESVSYLNGVVSSRRAMSGSLATNNRPLRIGRGRGQQHGLAFAGVIDEMMIFNLALTAEEINVLHDAQAGPRTSAPLERSGRQRTEAGLD